MEIKPKFNIGDKVFYLKHNKVQSDRITTIVTRAESGQISIWYGFTEETVWNKFDCANIPEDELFKTKEELLKSL